MKVALGGTLEPLLASPHPSAAPTWAEGVLGSEIVKFFIRTQALPSATVYVQIPLLPPFMLCALEGGGW